METKFRDSNGVLVHIECKVGDTSSIGSSYESCFLVICFVSSNNDDCCILLLVVLTV